MQEYFLKFSKENIKKQAIDSKSTGMPKKKVKCGDACNDSNHLSSKNQEDFLN